MSVTVREQFAQEVNQPDKQINLLKGTLLFAQYLGQTFEMAAYLQRLAEWAAPLTPFITPDQPADTLLERFNHYIFEELTLRGNQADYYNPNNSFLNHVLDKRVGIPISLGVIYLELGWRFELPMRGIGLPGHFVVAYGDKYDPVYVDVFNQQVLTEDECGDVVQVPKPQWLYYRQRYLSPMSKPEILYRMLLNLRHIYVGSKDWGQAYKVLDLMVALNLQLTDLRDRGLVAKQLEQYHAAIFDLRRYLFLSASNEAESKQLMEIVETMETYLLLNN